MPEQTLSPDEIRRRLRLIEAVDYAARCGRRSPGLSTLAKRAHCDRKYLHHLAATQAPIGRATQQKLSAALESFNLSEIG